MGRAAAASMLALMTSGLGAAAANAASDGITAASHAVERLLPRDRNRTLPVHEGGSVVVKANTAIGRLSVQWGGRAIRAQPVDRSGRRWRFELPGNAVPARVTLVGELGGRRFRRRLRLREHEHRPVETAPGRLVDGGEVFWIEWAFRPRSLSELFSAAPRSFPNRPTVRAAAVAKVVRTTRAHIPDDHPGIRDPRPAYPPANHGALVRAPRWALHRPEDRQRGCVGRRRSALPAG